MAANKMAATILIFVFVSLLTIDKLLLFSGRVYVRLCPLGLFGTYTFNLMLWARPIDKIAARLPHTLPTDVHTPYHLAHACTRRTKGGPPMQVECKWGGHKLSETQGP